MHSSVSYRKIWPIFALGVLGCAAFDADAATGARVLLQVWNPLTPDKSDVRTLLDNPSLVSDSLQDAWQQVRPQICHQLYLKMGLGGAAGGQTLSNIDCVLDEKIKLDIVPAGQNALRATFAVGGYVAATSTTPTFIGKEGDPRISVALTAKLDLTLAIQLDRDNTLHAVKAKFTLSNATLDTHNFAADLLKALSDVAHFFGGPDYKRMAEDAIDGISFDLTNTFNSALAGVNAQLRGPSDAIRVGVSGRDNYVSVAFAPREITPPANGRMTGLVRWDPAKFTPRNGCQSFFIGAQVQTGPAPLFANDTNPPMREVGTFQSSPAGENTCKFTLSGLADGWPNIVGGKVLDPPVTRTSGNANHIETYFLLADGWDGRTIVPQPTADGRNFRAFESDLKLANLKQLERAYQRNTDPINSRVDPAGVSVQANPAAARFNPSNRAGMTNKIDAQKSLSPSATVPSEIKGNAATEQQH